MAQHAALRDWLLSHIWLSMHLGSSMSFHGFKAHFFLVLKNTALSGGPQFIYPSPIEGHLGCFQVLAITTKAARNICMQGFVCISVVSVLG